MKIFIDNEGSETGQLPLPAPVQSFEERMGLERTRPVVAGQLSEEHKGILSAEPTTDRREFDYNFANGDFAKAFASQASSPLRKRKDAEGFEKADSVLRRFQEDHDKKSLAEQLRPLCERACAKLSKEGAERLRQAVAALDLSIVTFLLGEAFA